MLDSKKTLQPAKNEKHFPSSCLALIANTEGTTDSQPKSIK
jgi:hypothetical protein